MFSNPVVISRKRALSYILIISVVFSSLGFYFGEDTSGGDILGGQLADGGECNAMIITLYGEMTTYMPSQPDEYWVDTTNSEYVVDHIDIARADEDIKAVVLYVDSPGGSPVAGEEIANALKSLDKPTVAVVRGLGASAAYWAATGADKIYASRVSEVGSIGVAGSYLDESIKNLREGRTYVELTSAIYKDLGTTDRPMTAAERAIYISDLKKMHEVFVDDVALNRGLERGEVVKLANGLTYVGTDALEYGLIDEIGDLSKATSYLEEQIGEKPEFCWY